MLDRGLRSLRSLVSSEAQPADDAVSEDDPPHVTDGGSQIADAAGDGQADTAEQADAGDMGETPAHENRVDQYLSLADLSAEVVLDALPFCIFILTPEREVVAWNSGAEELTGSQRENVIGSQQVSEHFYQDGRRAMTLADKVVEAPRTAAEEYGVAESEDHDGIRYEDTSTMVNARGEEVPIWFTAQPIWNEAGEFVGVVEMVYDQSDDVEREEAIEALVTEISGTLDQIESGDLSARASTPQTANEHLEDDVVGVVDHVNDMAATLEGLTQEIETCLQELSSYIDQSAGAVGVVTDETDRQTTLLQQVTNEMSSLSASMEEIAATAEEVAANAEDAREAADEGQDASEAASEAVEEIQEASGQMQAEITELDDQLEDIVDVVGVIEDIAEQTNILALNANIEAARSGAEGNGFAVVADEIKDLADETKDRTTKISEQIDRIQDQTTATVDVVETSADRVDTASEDIERALDAFDTAAESINEVADGIKQVSDANDDQAATVEEVTSTVEQAEEVARDIDDAVADVAEASDKQEAELASLQQRVSDLRDTN